jgi:hypothetical protein
MNPFVLIPKEELDRVHASANFGNRSNRDVLNDAVLKTAVGYQNGSAAARIVEAHGLGITRNGNKKYLTAKGLKYLLASLRFASIIWGIEE